MCQTSAAACAAAAPVCCHAATGAATLPEPMRTNSAVWLQGAAADLHVWGCTRSHGGVAGAPPVAPSSREAAPYRAYCTPEVYRTGGVGGATAGILAPGADRRPPQLHAWGPAAWPAPWRWIPSGRSTPNRCPGQRMLLQGPCGPAAGLCSGSSGAVNAGVHVHELEHMHWGQQPQQRR